MVQDSLIKLVQSRLDDYCHDKRVELLEISEDAKPLIDFAQSLLSGGKRFRAQFCYWSWAATAATEKPIEQLEAEVAGIVGVAAALEMFHAAALVHDDLLDQSDTRRGAPSIHKRFETLHAAQGFAGDAARFGVAGSVLVGDLMLSWSSELFGDSLLNTPTVEIDRACRAEFGKMRFEVMAGQYLDVLEENAGGQRTPSEAVARANRVMLFKTAKYSIEAPLLIGAAYGGANPSQLAALSEFGIPLGMAFQLRDDVLGVFGDPEITGKPAGDDLREGKRTVMAGLTLEALSPSVRRIFEELLTSRDLDASQIEFMQQAIVECGALDKVERMISEYWSQSSAALSALDIDETAKSQLALLAKAVTHRSK